MDAHPTSAGTYLATWLALLALTTATLLLSPHTTGAFGVVVGLAFASAKATLVALFFMHLVRSHIASRMTLVVAVLFVALLVTLTALDVALRPPVPALQPVGG